MHDQINNNLDGCIIGYINYVVIYLRIIISYIHKISRLKESTIRAQDFTVLLKENSIID